MLHIVAYDICSPRRLRHVAKACKDYGFRVEKSVFECDLEQKHFDALWKRLQAVIDPDEDALIAYRICSSCESSIQSAGILKRPEKPIAYIF